MKINELLGRTLYVTSKYAKNVPFRISKLSIGGELFVDTYNGRNIKGKLMEAEKDLSYTSEEITRMLEKGILSFTKIH